MAMDSFDDVELYSLKSFDNAYAARKVLDHSLSDKDYRRTKRLFRRTCRRPVARRGS
mgnify:CR=1 FL=1